VKLEDRLSSIIRDVSDNLLDFVDEHADKLDKIET